jgi:hypothetical protein
MCLPSAKALISIGVGNSSVIVELLTQRSTWKMTGNQQLKTKARVAVCKVVLWGGGSHGGYGDAVGRWRWCVLMFDLRSIKFHALISGSHWDRQTSLWGQVGILVDWWPENGYLEGEWHNVITKRPQIGDWTFVLLPSTHATLDTLTMTMTKDESGAETLRGLKYYWLFNPYPVKMPIG